MACRLVQLDEGLRPYESQIDARINAYRRKKAELVGGNAQNTKNARNTLTAFADAYKTFGMHRTENGFVYREWAPNAEKMFLTGDFNGWNLTACPMQRKENGSFELILPDGQAPQAGQYVQAIVQHGGELLRRVPTHATRVVQDKQTFLWCAQLEDDSPFPWTDAGFQPTRPLFLYECHIGMSSEQQQVSSYRAFRTDVLPRIHALGYNAIQIMAVMEHPYYGSFGYQVTNFFAASSRFGTGRELKELIDEAHRNGIAVLLDVVHSHAAKNTNEGIAAFDGTERQFFREGEHPAWGTKLFDYGKNEVIRFLLSNLAYWMDEFHFDGFRFDGVTSMLYRDHGLNRCFTSYADYFSDNTDADAVLYLQLANELIHEKNPHAVTIAEDMSGMPGIGLPVADGGLGFDYRLGMGLPDLWIKFIKELPDERWDMRRLWYECVNRRVGEKTVGYCESHDQALVGDKTILFRLCDAAMYTGMRKDSRDPVIDRGVALHKMIRLLTASAAGEAYLNFMGNEFGHPEWIDFPREGNGWSYLYCRRQWSLADDETLRYGQLQAFDRAMVALLKKDALIERAAKSLWIGEEDKILLFAKGETVFAFNFHPTDSLTDCFIPTGCEGTYRVCLSTDEARFGGFGRIDEAYRYTAKKERGGSRIGFSCYLPARTAAVFEKL